MWECKIFKLLRKDSQTDFICKVLYFEFIWKTAGIIPHKQPATIN